ISVVEDNRRDLNFGDSQVRYRLRPLDQIPVEIVLRLLVGVVVHPPTCRTRRRSPFSQDSSTVPPPFGGRSSTSELKEVAVLRTISPAGDPEEGALKDQTKPYRTLGGFHGPAIETMTLHRIRRGCRLKGGGRWLGLLMGRRELFAKEEGDNPAMGLGSAKYWFPLEARGDDGLAPLAL
ncbi:hypothetical protein B296_00011768, partial [Ensete ventricosum]